MNLSPSTIAKNFPEIKDFVNDNPEYSLLYGMYSNMGAGWNNVEDIKSADYVVFYGQTAYLNTTIKFHISPVLFISDETSDEKIIETATARIKEYINNDDVNVVVSDVIAYYSDDELDEIYTDLDDFFN